MMKMDEYRHVTIIPHSANKKRRSKAKKTLEPLEPLPYCIVPPYDSPTCGTDGITYGNAYDACCRLVKLKPHFTWTMKHDRHDNCLSRHQRHNELVSNGQIINQITWNEIKFKSLEPKSQIKSNHDVNQMTTVRDSIVYARNVINLHLAWLSLSLQRLGMVLLPKWMNEWRF